MDDTPQRGPLHEGQVGSKQWGPIRGCDCGYCVHHRGVRRAASAYKRRRDKVAPKHATAEQHDEAQAKLLRMHERGLSIHQISQAMGVSYSTVNYIITGSRYALMAPITYRRVMDMDESAEPVPSSSRRSGAYLPIIGAQRRAGALNAIGFSFPFQGRFLGHTNGKYIENLVTGRVVHKAIVAETHWAVVNMYDKYSMADAVECGVAKHSAAMLRNRRVFAAPACWDDDTIDDPEAIPQWTGHCGKPRGYRLHIEREIPMCEACAVKGPSGGR